MSQDVTDRSPTLSRAACGWLSTVPSPIQAILLDLDGTLVDTLDEFDAALGHMFAELQLPPIERAVIAHTIGKGSEHLVRTVLALSLAHAGKASDATAVDALLPRAMSSYFSGYEATGHRLARLYPGVTAGLAQLAAKGYPMAVVTNKPLRLAMPVLQATGLAPQVQFLYGGDSFERRKPDPLPLRQACARLGSAPQLTLMIGDSRNDALAAHAAGCSIALLTYGFNHGEPIDAVPAHGYFDSIDALAQTLPAHAPS